MNDIIKIVQALEDSNILLKGVTKTIKNETKEQKGGFLSMLLGTLGASLLGNLLTGKGIVRAGSVRSSSSALQNKKRKEIVRAGSGRPLSSTLQNKKEKELQELVQVVLCLLFCKIKKKYGIFNSTSSFNKL